MEKKNIDTLGYIETVTCECGETFSQNDDTIITGDQVVAQFEQHVIDDHFKP